VLRLKQYYPFDWLVLGVSVEAQSDLERDLHPYVKDAVIGRISVGMNADASEVIEKARECRDEYQGRHIDDLVGQVQEYVGAGGRGTTGLKDTVRAINEQKVHILLLQEHYAAPGAECKNCGLLVAEVTETCPGCNESVQQVDNLVDLVVQKALELGSTVEVATEPEKLKPVDYVASIMYY